MSFKHLSYLPLTGLLLLALAIVVTGQDRPEVKEAQGLLAEKGYDAGPADGLMGNKTRTAIMDFQKDKDLIVTGELDQATLWALGIMDETSSPSLAKIRRLRVLTAGTLIPVSLQKPLDSATARVGNPFSCKVVKPVKVGGAVAISAGSIFNGRVAEVRSASKSPQGGELSLRIEALELDESKIPVEGYVTDSGKDPHRDDAYSLSGNSVVERENSDGVFVTTISADPNDDIRLDSDRELFIALAAELRIPLE